MARRLYHQDAYRRECAAVVTAVAPEGDTGAGGQGRSAIALTETIFYPTSGGQPSDSGWLDGVRVVDVREEGSEILHALDPAAAAVPSVGARVVGKIDWDRRFDHMQQHTGQHILSAAFLRALEAQTEAVHMGASCTLDLAIPALSTEDAARAETLANGVVLENRAVTIHEVESDELEALGLRRPPKQTGQIRVVEVTGFDRSACGGTHVAMTGEVGPIVVRGWERNKGGVRVEFACGWRALQAFRQTHAVTRELAGQFSVGEHELPEAIRRLRERARGSERDLTEARTALLAYEAVELVSAHQGDARDPALPETFPIIAAAFTHRTVDELRALARLVTAQARCVAILASDPDKRLVIARSAGVGLDAAAILRESLAPYGGRGGGRSEAAEGMAAAAPSAAALIDAARAAASRHIEPLRAPTS